MGSNELLANSNEVYLMREVDEEVYDDSTKTELVEEEDDDLYSGNEQGFIRGYEEDAEDPNEEKELAEEEVDY
jgi:hypothetical protein